MFCHICASEALKQSQLDAINQAWDSEKLEVRKNVRIKYKAFTWNELDCPHQPPSRCISSEWEEMLAMHLKAAQIPFLREFVAIPERKYRFDFAVGKPARLLVEVEGGLWIQSKHTTAKGIARDIEKGNLAVLWGFRLLRFTKEMIQSGMALRTIEQALGRNPCN